SPRPALWRGRQHRARSGGRGEAGRTAQSVAWVWVLVRCSLRGACRVSCPVRCEAAGDRLTSRLRGTWTKVRDAASVLPKKPRSGLGGRDLDCLVGGGR